MVNPSTSSNQEYLTFVHGVHPEEYKEIACACPIQRMPFVKEYVLPLAQHLGAPSVAKVAKGAKVKRGETIADPGGFVSVALHSPVEGTVAAIEPRDHPNGGMMPAIVIKPEEASNQAFEKSPPVDWKTLTPNDFVGLVQKMGLVGLGGAAFPAHVKWAVPEGKQVQYLFLNGCECEPFLTSDHRVMLEQGEKVIEGTRILLHFLKAERAFIGVEANKQDAISHLTHLAKKTRLPIHITPLQVKYPQGAEKMLISAILRKEVPSGKLPLEVKSAVSNVGSVAVLAEYFETGKPLIERVVTVTGTAIVKPANLLVPIGTPVKEVLEFCGGLKPGATRVILGGPMMGVSLKSLDVPVTKGCSGITVLTDAEVREVRAGPCIRCGRCLAGCPLFLNPCLLGAMSRKKLYEEMEANHLMDCVECASCSFSCPAGIPLVQQFRVAKAMLREKKAKK